MGQEEQTGEDQAFAKGDTVFMRRPLQRLPLNLAEWVLPSKLAQWVKEVVQNLDASKPEARELLSSPSEAQERSILRAVLYAYSTQVYRSIEIAAACRTDPTFQLLCEGRVPFPEEFERLRRKHRALLEALLGEIIVRAVSEKFANLGQLPPGFQNSLLRRAIDSIDTARHMDREE